MKLILKYKATISYIITIVLINCLFIYLPISHAFGKTFSIADFTVGSIYVVRDFAQRELGHKVIIAMFIGALLSYILADPTIAIASLTAFLIAESVDWALFTFTKRPLSKRLLISSSISSPIDSAIFLAMIQRFNWVGWSLMTTMKIIGVFGIWFFWKIKHQRSQMLTD